MNQIQPHYGNNLDYKPEYEIDFQAFQDALAIGQPGQTQPNNLEFIGRERDVSDFNKAAIHSTRVGLLKYLLPIIGGLIIALIVAALVMRPKLPANITIGSSGIEDGKLVMNNPKLDGFDPKNRPYWVEAVRAIQSIENPTLVNLDQITAKLPMEDGLWANIRAGNGTFDVTEKKLELGGGVSVVTTDGMKLILKDAYLDIKAGSMNTYRPIKFFSDKATISSQSLEVFDNGDRMIFQTDVRLVIQPPEKIIRPEVNWAILPKIFNYTNNFVEMEQQ